ncbi:MAG: peptidoglycan DD-metalloendopeptidase family protein [Gracilimonas sp.]|uniref:murein hydrolase activator EnvC family protein n=1 Tax=Gracilimonas sp. TaxID=1974203 RepID=UPI0037531C3B|nr:peptidoglycan DD-metalloendopeptidase family protein [Gracilimonas sp.]
MRLSSYIKTVITVCVAVLLSSNVFAQSYQERREQLLRDQKNTRAEINVLEARIKNYQQRVNQAEERFDRSYEQFQFLNNLIALQDDKINSLQEEQNQIDAEIALTQKEIELRELELEQLIENYKQIVLYAYKNGRSGNLEMLLTSESINQMLVRSNYLRRFDEQKTKQADAINEAKRELDKVKKNLEDSYKRNRDVLTEIQQEKNELADQRQQQEQTVEEIKQERSTWLAELRKTREAKEGLENTFQELEQAEAEAEAERLRKLEEARNIADTGRRTAEVERYSELSEYEESFAEAKGQLSWPVSSTTIARKFGRVRNPLYGTITEHPGIDIVSESGSEVKAVSDGYVTQILPMRGYGEVVIVKHGAYHTVYGNLSQIDVETGTVLKKGDFIGRSGTAQTELGEVLFFAVRVDREFVNPEVWLADR